MNFELKSCNYCDWNKIIIVRRNLRLLSSYLVNKTFLLLISRLYLAVLFKSCGSEEKKVKVSNLWDESQRPFLIVLFCAGKGLWMNIELLNNSHKINFYNIWARKCTRSRSGSEMIYGSCSSQVKSSWALLSFHYMCGHIVGRDVVPHRTTVLHKYRYTTRSKTV